MDLERRQHFRPIPGCNAVAATFMAGGTPVALVVVCDPTLKHCEVFFWAGEQGNPLAVLREVMEHLVVANAIIGPQTCRVEVTAARGRLLEVYRRLQHRYLKRMGLETREVKGKSPGCVAFLLTRP